MNATTRVITPEITQVNSWLGLFSRENLLLVVLIAAVMFSACWLIYIKDLNRRLISQAQMEQFQTQQLNTQWSKLLLEQSMLSAPARIQGLAQQEYGMYQPSSSAVIIVRE